MSYCDNINRRNFLKKTILGSTVLAMGQGLDSRLFAGSNEKDNKGRPNVIVITCDDLGWGDLSCYPQENDREGVPLNTPNINRLAAKGVRCTDGYGCEPLLIDDSYKNQAFYGGKFQPEGNDMNSQDILLINE